MASAKMADQEIKQEEEIVIVGAGIAGLAVASGLHRLGFKSLVLESSDCLRATGAALRIWTNGWQALDALGIGDSLRSQHVRLEALVANSCVAEVAMAEISFITKKPSGGVHEVRGLRRKVLLETLALDLPSESIRFTSKVVAIEESGYFKVVHLADGATIKAKVLIG
ncbi:Monooxygenase 3-like protein, partial [Drosera capensis]